MLANGVPFANPLGSAATVSSDGFIALTGPFFRSFGTNGRFCGTCHSHLDGWTITPQSIEARFAASGLQDPVFRPVDGAVCPAADVSSPDAQRIAYALLLNKGLIRVGMPIPANAEFELDSWTGTYCNQVSSAELSVYRRPLPATNLRFLAAVMWDGRETAPGASIDGDLAHQANNATILHAQQPSGLPDGVREQIVAFERNLVTAQVLGADGLALNLGGALGGPDELAHEPSSPGASHYPSDPKVFDIFSAWASLEQLQPADLRGSIARGEKIFNLRTFAISGAGGGIPDTVMGHCGSCHDAHNVGNSSGAVFFKIGTDSVLARAPDLPLYTLRNRTTGEAIRTSDPGRAMVTGRWEDIGAFKVPTLRGLAARAPYFHNGIAPDLGAVVDFHDQRFAIGFSPQERADLVAFLSAL